MKFEKLNDSMFKKEEVLTKDEMLNANGGEVWSTGCGKTYIEESDEVVDVCEWYDSDSEEIFYG